MPVDSTLVGRSYPPTAPHAVTPEHLAAFAAATGGSWTGGPAPATYPIVVAFGAMNDFLAAEALDLSRIIHGEQRFAYTRPIVPGDVLSATLAVVSLRQIGGNDIIGTRSEILDGGGLPVCATSATLVHRSGA